VGYPLARNVRKPVASNPAPESSPALPMPPDHAVRSLVEWIRGRENMQRPPETTAKILAFMVMLDDRHLPFPTRPIVAEHLGVSVPAIDVVLSQRQATDDIAVYIDVEKGRVRQRMSTVKVRRVVPSDEIKAVVHRAIAEDERDRAAMRVSG
jgi:hypothetical protein